jgi:ligand-binding sensor domain-containing protein/signal transduction histidine kinase
MRLHLLVAAVTGLVFGVSAGADVARYEHQTWRTENGLPQNSVHSIVQTSDGYIWLATEDGLARFDGLNFVLFDSENTAGLRSSNIRSLLEGEDKSLWIATADGLSKFRNGTFTSFTAEQGLPGNNVLSLARSADGRLWVFTAEGSAFYQNGRFDKDGNTRIAAVTVDRSGNIWAASEAGIHVLGAGGQRAIALPPELKTVRAILADESGRLWVGGDEGLFLVQAGSTQRFLQTARITALCQDHSGAIWVGTEAGVARLVDGQVYPIAAPESLSHGAILSFLEDREGDIWIGTDTGGVTVLRDQRFEKFGRDANMPDDLVRCVFEDSKQTLWAGTNGHGLRRFDGKRFSSLSTADGLSSDVILSLANNSEGDLLAGTPDGLNIVHGSHIQWLTSAEGLPDDFVRSIYKDTDGTLWMGTRRGLAHDVNGQVRTYTSAEGLPSDLVGAILRSRNGCLWVGTLKGLACLENSVFKRPAQTNGDAITALFEDGEGSLWIGRDARGLARLAGERVYEFPQTLGLPRTVSGIAEDAYGQFWITSPHGLFRVKKSKLDSYAEGKENSVSISSYGASDGLPVSEFSTGGHPTIWRDRQNTIWLASAKGVVAIDARHTAPNPVPPLVALERVRADDQVLDPARVTTLGPGLERISFEFTGLSFKAPQQIRFKYRLEGFDQTWMDAGTRRAAYYTNLPPGAYRFVVLARNNDGVWSTEAASLRFHLRPHFYQAEWFRGLLVLAVAIVVYGIFRWRVRHVRSEFKAVIAERNRIAREIHDTLAQGYAGISVQLEVVRRLLNTSLDDANEVLQQTQTLVQESLAEARRSIWDLRSEAGWGEDLPSKLSKAVRRTVQNRIADVRFEITGAYRPLPARVESEVLRIGKEAVTNAVRHSRAKRLEVRLAFDASKAQMKIRDDGQGFEPNGQNWEADGHFGLRGMRERAQGINAKLTVTAAAGEGTEVCLEVPLK